MPEERKARMSDRQYILLLNSAVKSYLIGLSSREKRRLREKFEFLENGLWDSGVRVKKLKGIPGKVIFEGRSTGSDRILFTLGDHAGKTAIYLWGVVKHEDVEAEAARILPQNAPFLNFEPFAQEELAEVSIDDLPPEYFTTEDIAEKSPDDYGPQKWLVLSPEEWKRILLSTDPDGIEIFLFLTPEQQAVLRKAPPILLAGTAGSGKTTIAVYYLLGKGFADKRRLFLTYSPQLKRFSEQIYDGLVRHTDLEDAGAKPDFCTFQELLLHILEGQGGGFTAEKEAGLREFEEIFRQNRLYRKYDAELVWEEIRSIIKGAKPPISVNRFGRLVARYLGEGLSRSGLIELKELLLGLKHLEIMGKIEKLVVLKAGYGSYEEFLLSLEPGSASASRNRVPLVLQEILRILEKKAPAFTEPLLTFQEYVTLGRKRAPNFVYSREEIYSIAEFYQGKLEAQGLWDEIDLCKSALQVLGRSSDRFLYDLVVCDEVQDFSDVQLALIFRLARDGCSVLLAGDSKQIINPSGFRWEEVRNKFYDRGMRVPAVLRLNLNFRCVGSIVKLSNALLDLKQELVGLSDTELREDWKFSGKPPVLVYGPKEDELLGSVRLTGAGQIILTRSREEQQKLKRFLRTELVFTIFEAKGLEFDSVLLWKFSEDGRSDLWRKICDGNGLDPRHHPHVRHELNLLYVAVTRARNTLVIYDGPTPARVWGLDRFRDKMYRSSEKGVLAEVWQRISTPAEWESQGDYFFERQYYPAAVECFRNAGNSAKMEIAEAFVLEGERRHAEAARLFEKNGLAGRAADNYEKAGDYARALDSWERLREEARARKCRILLYEQRGEYGRAAEEWEKIKEYDRALENWEKAGNHARVGQYRLAQKKYDKAAEAFARAKEYDKAASCYTKARKPAEAADCFFQAGDFRKAAAIYKKRKRPERLLECYLALGDHHAAALLYEKARRIEDAVGSFRKFAEGSEENRSRLLAEAERHMARNPLKAALRYSALSLYDRSAPIYMKKGFQERAVLEYRILGDHTGLADLYEKQGKFYEAALELERSQEEGKWERVTYLLWRHTRNEESTAFARPQARNRPREFAEKLYREAETLLQSGFREGALARFKAVGYPDGVSRACLALGRHEEALLYFMEGGLPSQGVRYLNEAGDFDISAGLLARLSRSQSVTGSLHTSEERQACIDLVVQLFRKRLRTHRDKETQGLVEEFLSRFGYPDYEFEEVVPDSFFDLALESRSYGTVFRAVLSQRYRKSLSPRVRSFLEAVRKEGEACDDRNLLACYWYAHDRARYESLLEDLPLTDRNSAIFSGSVLHYGKVVEYHVEQGRLREAVLLCRRYRDYGQAGSILEKAGHFSAAGKEYRDGKWYEDSMRCCRKANDMDGIARAHEGMKQYGQAIAIWTRLGRQGEVRRVRRKMEKKGSGRQYELF